MSHHDVIVIGSGITGLAAARQSLRHALSTITFEARFVGGLVVNINHLDGDMQGAGMDLAMDRMAEISDLGAAHLPATVSAITRDDQGLTVHSDAGNHRAGAVIVASGAQIRQLGVPGEAELENLGVSRCADCDGPLFQGQDIVVVGGGDSALQEALVLARFARQVRVVHRGSQFGGQAHLAGAVAAAANITVLWETTVEAVLGDDAVRAVRIRNAAEGREQEIACTGFFAYPGLEPMCAFMPDAIARDERGFLVTDAGLCTTLPGVFAAGAVRAGFGGRLAHAMAEGIAAADTARDWLRR